MLVITTTERMAD